MNTLFKIANTLWIQHIEIRISYILAIQIFFSNPFSSVFAHKQILSLDSLV